MDKFSYGLGLGIALVLNVTKNRSLSAAISTPQTGTTTRYIRRR